MNLFEAVDLLDMTAVQLIDDIILLVDGLVDLGEIDLELLDPLKLFPVHLSGLVANFGEFVNPDIVLIDGFDVLRMLFGHLLDLLVVGFDLILELRSEILSHLLLVLDSRLLFLGSLPY